MWDTNWLSIIVAALSAFAVGGIWYGPLFGKRWMRETGVTADSARGRNMPLLYGSVFVLNLFSAFILAHVLATYGTPDLILSVLIGTGIAGGFILPAIAVNYLFQGRSLVLVLIEGGYWLAAYGAMSAILAWL